MILCICQLIKKINIILNKNVDLMLPKKNRVLGLPKIRDHIARDVYITF